MSEVGVVIGTYGDIAVWEPLVKRAFQSVITQTVVPQTVWVHAESLQEARNKGAADLDSKWCIFLDADDELDPHYVEAMLQGEGDIRRPATLGLYEDGTTDDHPVMIPVRDIWTANYIVIGAMCRRDLFQQIGGFRDFSSLEDWDLWRRMIGKGATVGEVPDAIYKIHVRPNSRNADAEEHGRNYIRILRGG